MPKKYNSENMITWGDRHATINEKKDGKWQVTWKQEGKWRNTTALDRGAAVKKARTILKNLGSDDFLSKVSNQEYRAVALIREYLGSRNIVLVAEIVSRMLEHSKGLTTMEKMAVELERLETLQLVTFQDAFDRYKQDYIENEDISSETWTKPRAEFNNFLMKYPDLHLQDLESEDLRAWMSRGDIGPVTFNNRRSIWRTFYNRAMKRKEIDYNPTDDIEKRKEPNKHPSVFTPKQAQKCVDFLAKQKEPHLLFGFAVAAFAGMRPSEIQRLKPEHIDLKNGYINADENICRKLQHARYVPILPPLMKILKAMTFEEKDRTVTSPRRWKYISQRLRDAKVISEWPEDVLRHSYISYRNAMILNINQIAEECGNSADVIKLKYRRPITLKQGEKWFGIEVDKKKKKKKS